MKVTIELTDRIIDAASGLMMIKIVVNGQLTKVLVKQLLSIVLKI